MEHLGVSNHSVDLAAKLTTLTEELLNIRVKASELITQIQLVRTSLIPKTDVAMIEIILLQIRSYFNVNLKMLIEENREGDVMMARHIFNVLVKEHTSLSLAKVGTIVSRDHATVLNSKRVINNARDTNDILIKHYNAIDKDIKNIIGDLSTQKETTQ